MQGYLSSLKQFQDDVKSLIFDLLPKGNVSIERISRELAVSRWTLARKLRREKTTFKALLTAVRKELAIRYLETTQWSTNEIALLLGYSEASAFQRAFKAWTGKNPKAFRIFSENRLVGDYVLFHSFQIFQQVPVNHDPALGIQKR